MDLDPVAPVDGDRREPRPEKRGKPRKRVAARSAPRRELGERHQKMDPEDFEGLVEQLLVALGFQDVSVTSYSNDGGIDVRGTLVVREVIRSIPPTNFRPGAYEEAKRSDAVPVALMNGEQLVKLLVEHDIQIEKESLSLLRLG
ncbi:MAG: restriction endonuclease [Bradymonadaceae bacterium]